MPVYNLNGLGPAEFERLAQALIKKIIGYGTVTFGAGRDGAREAIFLGEAPYPSAAERWSGNWIFQAKFHDTALLGVDKARSQLVAETDTELAAITEKYQHPCDNYILITNVPLTSVPDSGTHARLGKVFDRYRERIRNFAAWGADDISRFLDDNADVRTAFLPFVVAGDLIAKLMSAQADRADEVSRTIQSYIRTTFQREQNAQLDQAGDVTDDPIRLQQVFFDLSVSVEPDTPHLARVGGIRAALSRNIQQRFPIVRFVLSDKVPRLVLIGGPGEGKSTACQYLAQLHRATLMQKSSEMAASPDYLPATPRLPFRVILKDYGQWLVKQLAKDANSGGLDDYICEHVRSTTTRRLTPAALHQVLAGNPILLILDGLDEITEAELKKVLLERLTEFTERCHTVYKSDIQVLATTRPTGYTQQFDPSEYLHVHLLKLEVPEVLAYVTKWIKAKEFEPAKGARVLESMEECVADPQIRAMATTPLQATILAVIVALGGTPPRQREALFNEYLEVIYKRETAKGRHIIQSDKERLIGLHKYVGYLLHEMATAAQAVGAFLEKPKYEEVVSQFLAFRNPYLPKEAIEKEHRAITKDAGDRLVLIVEPVQGRFGFELRSIQEFFAACYLVDTSKSTGQRYQRFEAISRLAHWRNVALFFAGRVGRNYEGEVFCLVEVCRDIDRSGPDRFTCRGSGLALEMAADQSFGSNGRGQRSLLEHGLQILNSDLSTPRRKEVCNLLLRLTPEDVRDHVIPLLAQSIGTLDASRLENFVYAAYTVGATSLAEDALIRMAPSDSAPGCLQAALTLDPGLLARISPCTLLLKIGIAEAGQILAISPWGNTLEFARLLLQGGLSVPDFVSLIESMLVRNIATPEPSDETKHLRGAEWEETPAYWVLASITLVLTYRSLLLRDRRPSAPQETWEEISRHSALPKEVMEGRFEDCLLRDGIISDAFMAPLWASHLSLGDVTKDSISKFVAYYSRSCHDTTVRLFLRDFAECGLTPSLDLLIGLIHAGATPTEDEIEIAVAYAGNLGTRRWLGMCAVVQDGLGELLDTRLSSGMSASKVFSLIHEIVSEMVPAPLTDFAIIDLGYVSWNFPFVGSALKSYLQRGTFSSPALFELRRLTTLRAFNNEDHNVFLQIARKVIRDNPPFATEVLVAVLPSCIANSHALGDEEIAQALRIIGNQEPLRLRHVNRISGLNSARLRRLLEFAASDEESIRRGLFRLIEICAVAIEPTGSPRVRPKFAGLAGIHRGLLTSTDIHARRAGIALYYVRPPSGREDYQLLGDLLRSDFEETRLGFRLTQIIKRSIRSNREVAVWIMYLSQWLEDGLAAPVRARVVAELDRLLSMDNQSIRHLESSLGLPLQA